MTRPLNPAIPAAMKELAVEQRRLLGARAGWHVGDIACHLGARSGTPITPGRRTSSRKEL